LKKLKHILFLFFSKLYLHATKFFNILGKPPIRKFNIKILPSNTIYSARLATT